MESTFRTHLGADPTGPAIEWVRFVDPRTFEEYDRKRVEYLCYFLVFLATITTTDTVTTKIATAATPIMKFVCL